MRIRLISILCFSATCHAQTFVVRGARIFDGEKLLGIQEVLVVSGKISVVARRVSVPRNAVIVDGRGKTLLPGLIDSHAHIRGSHEVGQVSIRLRKLSLFGVTTAISLVDLAPREIRALAASQPAGELADFLTAGNPVTVKGGHVARDIPIPTLDDSSQAQTFVDARIAEGSDVIKVIYEDFGGEVPRLPKPSMEAAIASAHARGKLAVVHAGQGPTVALDALAAGADGIVHSFVNGVADAAYGRMFVEHRAFLVPTLPLLVSVCNLPDNAALSRDSRIAPWLTELDAHDLKTAIGTAARHGDCSGAFASIRILRDAGATILAGTDAGNEGTAFGASLHEELELLVRNGLSPEQALRSGTSNAAKVWRLPDRGRIAPGMRADLLLVNGDPMLDITVTRDISGVWLAGFRVDRRALFDRIKTLERATTR